MQLITYANLQINTKQQIKSQQIKGSNYVPTIVIKKTQSYSNQYNSDLKAGRIFTTRI